MKAIVALLNAQIERMRAHAQYAPKSRQQVLEMSAIAMEVAPKNLEQLIEKIQTEPEHFDRIFDGIDSNHDGKVKPNITLTQHDGLTLHCEFLA